MCWSRVLPHVEAEKQKIKYRSYKNFDEKCFNDDISQVPFHVAHVFEDVDDIYWANEWLLVMS